MTTPSSAGELATREPSPAQKQIIDDILLLYQLHPSKTAYSHYSPNATFHDPISIAHPLSSIQSQFNSMPKLFAESTTQKCSLLAESTDSKLALNLTQHYVFKSAIPFKSKGVEKTVNSKVTLHLNGEGFIERHDEEWDHEGNKSGDDGFFGKVAEGRKKAGAKMVEKAVTSDPNKV
ncbi:hypothetical protein ACLMJK_001117 [Lecanora helva]